MTGSGIGTIATSPIPNNDVLGYRTAIRAALQDTGIKYSNTTVDQALRRCLNDYTRAFPDFGSASITLTATGRKIALTAQTDLISVFTCLHPYVSTLTDIYQRAREDYTVTWTSGVPYLHFSQSPIPVSGEKIYLEYTKAQTITDLDGAVTTTVRLDHKAILVSGAAGFSALIRSQSLNESWGGFPGQMPNLSQWGNMMLKQFHEQLVIIRQELNLNPFTKKGWSLDEWDT
jgi:hypothetical protein